MNTAAALMTDFAARGVTLAADGDRLRFTPRSAVTGDDLAALRKYKGELLAMLAGGPVIDSDAGGGPQDSPTLSDPSRRTCPACGSARIAHGRRRLWCIDCEADAGPVDGPQDLPEGDAEGRPERIGDAAPVIDDHCGRLVAIPDETAPARSGWRLPPWPPAVPDSMLADPPTPCSDCGRPVICGKPGRPAGLCLDCWQVRARQPAP